MSKAAAARRGLELKRSIAIKRIDDCLLSALEAQNDKSRLPVFLSRYSRLESCYSSFEAHHLKICSEILDTSELEKEDEIRHDFDNKYFEIIQIHSTLTSASQSDGHQLDICTNDLSVKLPRLNLLTFNGDITLWSSFYDMYNTTVHHNKRLSNIERFSILISLLSGEPLNLLKGFPLSGNNYLDAYAALIDRYQCKRKLAFRYWEELQNVTLESNSPRELRRLVDTFKENIAVLKNLKLPVKDWDFPLFYLLINKLDRDTRQRFELQNDDRDIPSFDCLLEYLNKVGQALELAEPQISTARAPVRLLRAAASGAIAGTSPTSYSRTVRMSPASAPQESYGRHTRAPITNTRALIVNPPSPSNIFCVLCKAQHNLANCPTYRDRTPRDRFSIVKDHNLCVNCLRQGHVVKSCSSNSRCLKCKALHHTTLHFENSASSNANVVSTTLPIVSDATAASPIASSSPTSHTLVAGSSSATYISLLATASVEVLDNFGNYRSIRIVIDNGSQRNFITNRCAQRLGLTFKKTMSLVEGIGQSSSVATSSTVFRIRGQQGYPDLVVEALVIPKICGEMPSNIINIAHWPQLMNIKLADSNFNVPAQIDALVGVDVFCQIVLGERRDCGPNGPVAFNTKLGWIIMGNIACLPSTSCKSMICSFQNLDLQIRKFWEIDELPKSSLPSDEDALCERIFDTTHRRDVDGRYIVRLPFKTPMPTFGDSYTLAHRRLLSLEKRLARDSQLREDYNAFMRDYLDSGHMENVEAACSNRTYYIPHHCVLKPSSSTTKLRVVFDASAKPASGVALNEQLLVGPILQSDIKSILLRFRLHSIVFTADIKQMYRQILVANVDRDYQRILFRFSPQEPIQEFRLKTVTYGMSSSSFLALRTILQVAQDEGNNHPFAVTTLTNDMYVDDIVSGADSLVSARALMKDVSDIISKGCFELRKWTTNCPALLEGIPAEHRHEARDPLPFSSETSSSVVVLGLEWHPNVDAFSFTVTSLHQQCTKRIILSELARIFDPLGFLTPVTFTFKCIVQKLWSLGLNWDEVAPDSIVQTWSRYRAEFNALSSLTISRFVPALNSIQLQIHGFCDASELGYAAVIYFRNKQKDDHVTTHLIIARSKVAPLKKISIPRLELCAAVLLADLVAYVQTVFADKVSFDGIFCWSDSTVTLAWIKSPSSRWKTYVSNRVSHIQEIVPPSCWQHVRSSDNSADCASRGLTIRELLDHPSWWHGPPWLLCDSVSWPISSLSFEDSTDSISEQRNSDISLFVTVDRFDEFLDRYSSLRKVQRIVAYIHRFVYNCRNSSNRKTGHLIASELKQSLLTLVKIAQASSFKGEIQNLEKGLLLPKPLQKLYPFIDKYGLVRVGGRLTHSDLDYDCKYPLLLSRQHRLTSLIIDQCHNDNLHPGLRTLSFLLAQNFWILSPRRAIRSRLSKCIKCYRTNPRPVIPRMADLPKLRVSQLKPFSCIGVDFAGPFPTYVQRYRGARTFKTYVCLFICFATKAIHIELVVGLTSEAFLGALRRFIARRGRCQRIHCDHGTNFVGAHNMLLTLMQQAASNETIEFSFKPPAAPHFGGLWEANIKSFKTHLARVVGNQILTYEEFFTLATQIEALLNSRPLCEMGSDPNDLAVLTPGHFLTLEPLTSLPESDLSDARLSCLNRWQLLQRLHHDFWKRWYTEYLHTLNQRSKWHTSTSELKLGSLVLVKDEQTKPLKWPLARIVQLHPGKDGISRVATVKTQTGLLQRPLVKLCPLPSNN